jgi:rod shape-determining protein MreC
MDIQTGDEFVSSGLGQLITPDFPVPKVSSVAYNPVDSFMKVKARALADFTKTREILMIWRADYSSQEPVPEEEDSVESDKKSKKKNKKGKKK